MKRWILEILVIIGGIQFGLIAGIISWYSTGISLQETTLAQYRDNQNKYDAFWKSVTEVAQIPDKYKTDFKDIVLSETRAKYGDSGSNAMFQWFQDRNLTLPSEIYTKIQTVIESGRADFKRGQQDLLDKQRRTRTHYKTVLGSFCRIFTDFLENVEGELKPIKDLDGDGRYTVLDYDIITSRRTKRAFETGEDDPIDVFIVK